MSKKNLLVSKKFVILLLCHFDNAKIIQIFEIPKFFDEKNHEKMIFFFLKNHKYQIIKELWKQKNLPKF